jgi:hypothetical protein
MSPADDGWRAHAHGISEILKLCGSVHAGDSIWRSLCSRLHLICVRVLTKCFYHDLLLTCL